MSDAPAVGTVLDGKYRVERVLGQGGMGFVVAARHLAIDEPVAVKLLQGLLAHDPDLVLRFQREAKAARKIKSEHVVKILDVGALPDGAPYLVMEYLDGLDLDRVVREQGAQPVQLAIAHLLQATEALAEAHVQGMVHRDLKPANLFVTRRADGSPLVKVLDFGISKVTGTDGADLGQTKTSAAPMGSPLYMAPEQMRSLREVDARTDIWALGVILHELLGGRPPWTGATMPELCAAILQDPPPPLAVSRPDVPPGLEAVIHRCLAKDPAARFPDVAAMATALAPFASAASQVSIARIRGVFQNVQNPRNSAAPMVARSNAPPHVSTTGSASWAAGDTTLATSPASRGPMIAIAIGFALLTALGVATLVFVSRTLKAQQNAVTVTPPVASTSSAAESLPEQPAIDIPVAAPVTFDPISGAYGHPFDVTLASRTPHAVIHYTTNGETPTDASLIYAGPIRVATNGTTVKAIATERDHKSAMVTFAIYMLWVNGIDAPVSVDFGEVDCGRTADAAKTFRLTNKGPETTFAVAMALGPDSPFDVSAQTSVLGAAGAAITVKPKQVPARPESLDAVADKVVVTLASGQERNVTIHERGRGAALELSPSPLVDLGALTLGKTSEEVAVTVRNTGDVDAPMSFLATRPFAVTPRGATVHAGGIETLRVTFTPDAPAPVTGHLLATAQTPLPMCQPPALLDLRGEGLAKATER